MKISPFKIEEGMNYYEKNALYDLTTTCIKPMTLKELLEINSSASQSQAERDIAQILNTPLGYGDITGSERLKNNIKSLYTKKEGVCPLFELQKLLCKLFNFFPVPVIHNRADMYGLFCKSNIF